MNMKDLLVGLFAMSLLYVHRKPTKEMYEALKSPGFQSFAKDLPGLKATSSKFMKGDYDFSELNDGLKTFTLRYKAMPTSKLPIVNLLSGFTSWIRTDNASGYAKMEKASASPAFPSWIQTGFLKDVGSQDTISKKLMKVVQRLGGPEGAIGFESPEQAAKAKDRRPDDYREYLLLRKQFNEVWKSFMSNFVRKSGKPTVPYQDLLKAFRDAKIAHGLPVGFTGKVDANGQWYTTGDRLVSSPPQATMFPSVKMNPNYQEGDDQWYYVAVRPDGSLGNYGYDTATVRDRVANKFAKVRDFMGKVEGMRKKWLSHVMKYDGDVQSTAAVVLELLYQTHARVGGSSTETFGMSVLLVKHYKAIQGGFQLHYKGKDGVDTKHVYHAVDPVSKKIVAIMAGLVKGKSPKDPLFTFKNGSSVKKMGPSIVNAMFRQCGAPEGVTVHKLRTYHGTKLFDELLEKVFAKYKSIKTPKDAMLILNEMAIQVGKALNHVRTTKDGSTKVTPATALSAYIDHSSQIAFFQHYGMPLPRHLQKAHLEASALPKPSILVWAAENDGQKITDKPAKKGDDVNKPQKPKMPDTKPMKMEETKPQPEAPAPKEKPESGDKGDEEDQNVPQTIGNLEVTQEDIDAIEEEEKQEKKDDKVRRVLEKQAEKFEYMLTVGGDSGHDLYDDEVGPDNILMKEAFKTGAP